MQNQKPLTEWQKKSLNICFHSLNEATYDRFHVTLVTSHVYPCVLHQQKKKFGYETKVTEEWMEIAERCEVCRLSGCFPGNKQKPLRHLMGCEKQKVGFCANYWSHRIKSLRDATCDEKEVGLKQLLLNVKRFNNSSVRVTLLQVRMLSQTTLVVSAAFCLMHLL